MKQQFNQKLAFEKSTIVELNTQQLNRINSGNHSTITMSIGTTSLVQLTILINMTTITWK